MPENNDTFELGANNIYIEDIEGEEGKKLILEPDLKKQFVQKNHEFLLRLLKLKYLLLLGN